MAAKVDLDKRESDVAHDLSVLCLSVKSSSHVVLPYQFEPLVKSRSDSPSHSATASTSAGPSQTPEADSDAPGPGDGDPEDDPRIPLEIWSLLIRISDYRLLYPIFIIKRSSPDKPRTSYFRDFA